MQLTKILITRVSFVLLKKSMLSSNMFPGKTVPNLISDFCETSSMSNTVIPSLKLFNLGYVCLYFLDSLGTTLP